MRLHVFYRPLSRQQARQQTNESENRPMSREGANALYNDVVTHSPIDFPTDSLIDASVCPSGLFIDWANGGLFGRHG